MAECGRATKASSQEGKIPYVFIYIPYLCISHVSAHICARIYTHNQSSLFNSGFCICKITYALEFTYDPQTHTRGAFVDIHRHVQNGNEFEHPPPPPPSAHAQLRLSKAELCLLPSALTLSTGILFAVFAEALSSVPQCKAGLCLTQKTPAR